MRILTSLLGVALLFGSFSALSAQSDNTAQGPHIPFSPVIEQAPDRAPVIDYVPVLSTHEELRALDPSSARIDRALQPLQGATAFAERIDVDLFDGGKLLLTNGISSLEGSSGGGIVTWATIAGREMEGGIGASAHLSAVELPDYGLLSYGVSIGIADRVELSYARQNFDTRDIGAAFGLGQGFTFNQDIYSAKLRLAGDVVYGAPAMPQIAVGIQYKRNLDAPVVSFLGAQDRDGVDYTFSATKLLLEHSLLVSATARLTEANQLGLLGFGGPDRGYELQFEGTLAYQLSRRAVLGAEYRSKPDNLGLGEDDWLDIFAAYALTENITFSAAYVDLGSIATIEDQRGGFVQAQIAF